MSISQGAADNFAYVVAQVGLGRDAFQRFLRGMAVGFGQFLPAIQCARQACGHLRVDGIQGKHLLGPEHITGTIGAMKGARVGMKEHELAGMVEGIAISAGGRLSYPVILSVDGQILHNH